VSAGAAAWTDWLTAKLRAGELISSGWIQDKEGITTDDAIRGVNMIPYHVSDCAVRLTYDLRDSEGIQITMRERKGTANERELYVADDTGRSLYIGRMLPDRSVAKLVNKDYAADPSMKGPRMLEFRCEGNRLTATLKGATKDDLTISAVDGVLDKGPCALVMKKGALLRKAEVMELPPAPAVAWKDGLAEWMPTRKNLAAYFQPVSDGQRVLTSGQLQIGFPIDPKIPHPVDAAMRVTATPGDRILEIALRQRSLKGGGRTCFRAVIRHRALSIDRMEPSGQTIADIVKEELPAALDLNQPVVLEFTARGSKLVATLNGSISIEASDPTPRSGTISCLLQTGGIIHKLDYALLDAESPEPSQPAPTNPIK